MLSVKRYEARLEPYDEQWDAFFEEIQSEVRRILSTNVIDIQHIGSTAIKNMVAKPLIDVAVVVRDLNKINLDAMKRAGYIYRGEAGVPGRSFFAKYRDEDISTHHIHCYEPDNRNLLANIAFRDYLILHPNYAKQYHDLKLHLAARYANDRIQC